MMEKDSIKSNYSRVTRKFTHCLRCNKPLSGRQEKFCRDICRWNFHNHARLDARYILIEREIEHLQSEGYEVTKKGG
jgi:hypothetical protein